MKSPGRKASALLLLLVLAQPQLLVASEAARMSPSPAVQTPATGAQQPLHALSPGTVTYRNTWNSSSSAKCPAVTTPKQPLATIASNWTINLLTPTSLFMGVPSGTNVNQKFVLFPNGTFLASDDRGNAFKIRPLGGLPAGLVATALKANSTTAFLNYAAAGGPNQANVTVSYKIRNQYCQQAGLKLTISGRVAWGAAGQGELSLRFAKAPIRTETNRAWFGNRSGVSLGFDWSDSVTYTPTFRADTNDVAWHVGNSFSIDPTTVASVSWSASTYYSPELKSCYAAGLNWAFYFDGTNVGYRTSSDGSSWGSEGAFFSGASDYSGFAVACSGSYIYYAEVGGTGASSTVYYRFGQMTSSGSINWSINQGSFAPVDRGGTPNEPNTVIDRSGNW